jgi:PII-like signaling protein
MNTTEVTVVRVYLAEGQQELGQLMDWLQQQQIGGFSVFRGIAGMGAGHQMHTASLLDLSAELPIVIEFFDNPERVEYLVEQIKQRVEANHILMWPAQIGV